MNKEELEKESKDYAKVSTNSYKDCLVDINDKDVLEEAISEAYLAGAEPREKRIAEAEELIKEIISTYENPRTVIPFKCAIKHAKQFIKWKE